jgi:hypothetical protein
MENLKLPAYPVISGGGTFENGYDGFKPGFTKLELASLMIAQGHVNNFDMGNHTPAPQFLEAFAAKCVCLAKAVLEEANK